MKKKDILKCLRTRCTKEVNLPTDLGLELVQDQLVITLQGNATITNMQADASSFEGWALVLKRWMPEVKKVTIKWGKPSSERTLEKQHYQRFLYRVKRFCNAYSWCEIDKKSTSLLLSSLISKDDKFILNTPTSERSRNYTTKKELYLYSEIELEEFILSDARVSEKFKQNFDLKYVDNQLPVGVFKDAVSNSTKIFTGGKSAIDIWGINTAGDCCIFELKNSKNRKVGALTEMLFYSFVVNDVTQGVFEFNTLEYKGLQDIAKAKKVKCFLLAPSVHPLIDKEVFELLNSSSSTIEYRNAQILKDFTFKSIL